MRYNWPRQKFSSIWLGVTSCEDEDDFHFLFKTIKDTYEKVCNQDYAPNILVADNAEAITNGFTRVYGKPKKVTSI